MSKEKRRVPKLRFPGFTEDWEQRKLGNLYKRVNERNDGTLGRDKWISVAKMYFQDPDKVQSNNLDTRTYVMKKGDIAFEGHPNNEFKFGRFVLNDIGTGIISELFPIYRPITEYDLDFWKYAIQLERVMAPIFAKSITSSGNSSNKLDHNHFLNQELLVPNIDEQKKIGTLLSILSKNITLHQRKLEHLNLKKKALLQKLFPKNGERYPELRFPGFTDAWEQCKLGDFTTQINTFVNPEDAKLPLWSLTAEAGLIEKTDRYERDFLVKKKDQFKRIETNTLVYNPMNITIGSIDIYTGTYPIAVSGYYVSIVYDKNIDTDFLKEVLLLPSSLKMYKNYATGSLIERQRVQYPTFSKLQLLFPNLDEQRAIGQLFKSLNLNITLHQRKLDHLQLQKKALLQQMFV